MNRSLFAIGICVLILSISVVGVSADDPVLLPDVIYITGAQDSRAEGYRRLLAENQIESTLLLLSSVTQSELDKYRMIIIDPGIRPEELTGPIVNAINSSGLPVLGIGTGGLSLFQNLQLSLGTAPRQSFNQAELLISSDGFETEVGRSQIVRLPYNLVSGERILLNSSENLGSIAVDLPRQLDLSVMSLRSGPQTLSGFFSALALEKRRFVFWGFDLTALTSDGQKLFINTVYLTFSLADNCIIGPYQMDDQRRFRFARLGDGAVTRSGTSIVLNPVVALSPEYLRQQLAPIGRINGNSPVLIIIVDDFSYPTPQTSHGMYVEDMYRRVLGPFTGGSPGNISIERIDYAAPTLLSRTRNVVEELKSILTYTLDGELSPAIERHPQVVVNFSGAIVPCDRKLPGSDPRFNRDAFDAWRKLLAQSDGKQKGPEDILSYWEYFSLMLDSDEQVANALLLSDSLAGDPLRYQLRFAKSYTPLLTLVASAGNAGDRQSLPYYPALWPEFISVSAPPGTADINNDRTPDELFISQNGEVRFPGGWFLFELPGDQANYQIGTSFAAPFMGTAMAVNMINDTDGCATRLDRAIWSRPELPIETTIPRFGNISLRDWLNQYGCELPG